jgi:hypothetical protein
LHGLSFSQISSWKKFPYHVPILSVVPYTGILSISKPISTPDKKDKNNGIPTGAALAVADASDAVEYAPHPCSAKLLP